MSERTITIEHEISLEGEFIQQLLEYLDDDQVLDFFLAIADELEDNDFDQSVITAFEARISDEEI